MSFNISSKIIKILFTTWLKTGKLSMIKDTKNTYSHLLTIASITCSPSSKTSPALPSTEGEFSRDNNSERCTAEVAICLLERRISHGFHTKFLSCRSLSAFWGFQSPLCTLSSPFFHRILFDPQWENLAERQQLTVSIQPKKVLW